MKSKLFHKIKSQIRNPNSDIEGLYYPGKNTADGIRVNGKDYLIRNGDYKPMPDGVKVEGQTIQPSPRPIINLRKKR